MQLKSRITGNAVLFSLACVCCLLLSSCAIIRGYRADGQSGPDIYSFEHHVHDTIANGTSTFSFPYARQQAEWIDTLHFFNQGKRYKNVTLWEALKGKTDTQGVLIIHDDSIVYEHYVGDITIDRLGTVFSVSKSITSLMCGIAVYEGYIKSVDDVVGLDFDDTYSLRLKELNRLNAMAKLNYGHNLMKQIRGLKFRCEPGKEHRYESMTAEILGVVIERATGQRYIDYLSEKVWKPLQMESPAVVNIDSRKHGVAHAFGGISTTMQDLAKIGRLYMNGGVWNGQRIVSEEWIHQTTDYSEDNDGYHFNWYNLSSIGADKAPYPGYYAHGIRGQVLYVNPYKRLIMVRMGRQDNTFASIPYVFEQLSNFF